MLDALTVFLAFVLAQYCYAFASGGAVLADASYKLVGLVTGLIHYAVARTRHEGMPQFRPNSEWQVLRSLLISVAIVIVVGYVSKQAEIHSRLWLGLSFALAFVLIVAKNRALGWLMHKGRLREFFAERIALFGDPAEAAALKCSLEEDPDVACHVGVYEFGAEDADNTSLKRLIADGLEGEIDRIILCPAPGRLGTLKQQVDAVSFLPARIEICVAQPELQALRSALLVVPGQLLVPLDDRPQDEWGVVIKRTLDLVLGTLILVLAMPVMIAAAAAIKLESKGPVFFRQRRHGWNHSIISVWKLRTMTVQEDGDQIKQAIAGDPRITRVGRFLRRTSIDELPQLFNVLAGEMSLVGPRPHAVAHNVHYSELIATYASRHKVKPGMTGWAQVKDLRGNSEDISKMIARAEADIWYIRNWSVLMDLKILAMTPLAVLFQKNAV